MNENKNDVPQAVLVALPEAANNPIDPFVQRSCHYEYPFSP